MQALAEGTGTAPHACRAAPTTTVPSSCSWCRWAWAAPPPRRRCPSWSRPSRETVSAARHSCSTAALQTCTAQAMPKRISAEPDARQQQQQQQQHALIAAGRVAPVALPSREPRCPLPPCSDVPRQLHSRRHRGPGCRHESERAHQPVQGEAALRAAQQPSAGWHLTGSSSVPTPGASAMPLPAPSGPLFDTAWSNCMQANQAYVNVHDEQNPAGVVRGQVEWV